MTKQCSAQSLGSRATALRAEQAMPRTVLELGGRKWNNTTQHTTRLIDSLTLCADKNVTIEGSALVVNGVDVLMTTSNLKAELLNTKAELLNTKAELADLKVKTKDELATKAELLKTTSELAALKAQVAALTTLKAQTQTSPASGSLVGTLLASPPPLSREPSPCNAQRRVTAESLQTRQGR
jgi:hypothetical protein